MEANEKNDQLEFALNVLNHPELLQDEYVREWLSHAENKKWYEECRLYLEAGLNSTGKCSHLSVLSIVGLPRLQPWLSSWQAVGG